jgi:hypothetical protein
LKKQWQWQKLERKRGDELEREKGGEVEERRCFGLTLIYLVII